MGEKTLLDYWIILYRRKREIVSVTVVAVITAIILSKMIKPVYEARATIYVPSASQALSYLSPDAMDRLAIDTRQPVSKKDVLSPYIGILKSKHLARLVHEEFPEKRLDKLLRSDIDFQITPENMISIYSRDRDPELAAEIANAYVRHFNRFLLNASISNLEADRQLIKRRIEEIKGEITQAMERLKEFEERNRVVSIDEEIKSLTSQRTSFQNKLEAIMVQLKENEEKIKAVSDQLGQEEELLSVQQYSLTNPLIEYFQKRLADLSAQIAASSVELTESHPDMVMLRNQYNVISDRLKEEIQRLISSRIKTPGTFYEQLRQELVNLIIQKNTLNASLRGYKEVIERINSRLSRLPSIKAEWERLNDDVDRLKKVYEQLKLNLQEAEMQRFRDIQLVVVVEKATPPSTPSFPVLWLNIVVALMGGLIGGVFYAFFVDYLYEAKRVRRSKIIKEILSQE
jgi:uncharacterized protein involved in exopolysaccharide biosynthesis